MRAVAAATMSTGRIMPDGSWSRTAASRRAMAARRGWSAACGQIDTRAPGFVQRVGRCVDHAGSALMLSSSPIGVAGRAAWMAVRRLVVDGTDEAAGQPDGGLLEGHDLEAVTTVTACRQPAFPHGEAAVNDQGGSIAMA
jgi:hypothetical protein